MKEEQFKVLKTMSEATSRMDINMLAKKVDLNPNQTMQQIQELTKEGFLQKVGGGFGITERGKAAIRVFTQVSEETAFRFYNGIDHPTNFTAKTLEEFYEIIKQITVESIEFHLYRGDFENWLKQALKDTELSKETSNVKVNNLKGEDLRIRLLEAFDSKYGIEKMK